MMSAYQSTKFYGKISWPLEALLGSWLLEDLIGPVKGSTGPSSGFPGPVEVLLDPLKAFYRLSTGSPGPSRGCTGHSRGFGGTLKALLDFLAHKKVSWAHKRLSWVLFRLSWAI